MNVDVILKLNFWGWLRATFTGQVKLSAETARYIAAGATAYQEDDDE